VADRLFEPFARGERAEEQRVEGAGLGLAIVRDQCDAIGATITVGPSPFGGARFTLELESAEPFEAAAAQATGAQAPGPAASARTGGAS
jgi:signal transduction histidine kinase